MTYLKTVIYKFIKEIFTKELEELARKQDNYIILQYKVNSTIAK